jgi:putative hydrolase of the HAD superfamily
MKFDWRSIDTVLLDMDGTLLDRHYDDHFWLEHVPRRYAARHAITLEESRQKLYRLFKSQEKTLNWTDLDYWSECLDLDIPLLKLEIEHLIAVHPFVTEFLLFLRHSGKRIHLVTNAHSKTLSLKMKRTRLGPYFDSIISAHDLGLPKEDIGFWHKLREKIPFDPPKTMLGEDSEDNLASARAYGIGHLVFISGSSSALTPVPSADFFSVQSFGELIPRQEQE